jgi:tRNA (adenine22-N1)-methyltransferase
LLERGNWVITLSPRLATVAEWILSGEPMADIGTDHGYLPVNLIQTGWVPRAIAADVLPGPLEAARAAVNAAGLADRIELRLGSGLSVVNPGEVASVSVCGMGGGLIAAILAAGPLTGIQRLILQPMGGEERLRQWCAASGYAPIAERLVADGDRIYLVMAVEPGGFEWTEADLLIGPLLRQGCDPLLHRYLQEMGQKWHRALMGAKRSHTAAARQQVRRVEQRLALIEEAMRSAEPKNG